MRTIAIIAAGGRGTRMGKPVCKQFLKLKGRSIIARTISKFQKSRSVDGIVVGVTPGEEGYFEREVLGDIGEKKILRVVKGGDERQETVLNCLKVLPESCKIVLVHDGVRPFVSEGLIDRVVSEAALKGAVIPGLPAVDTTKVVNGGAVLKTLDRKKVWMIQTPQGFKKDIILKAYDTASTSGVTGTDDASLVEALGVKVYVINGERSNIKITTPEDLKLASLILENSGIGNTRRKR